MNRYLPWILAALVAFPAMAAAQDATDKTTIASETFALGAEKPRAEAEPGGATYVLHAKSRVEQALALGIEGLPDGYVATYSPAELKVGPDAPARTLLTVHAREGAAAKSPVAFVAYATNEAGERHAVKLALSTIRPSSPAAAFGIKIDPEGARVEPNGTTKLVVHVRSAHDQAIHLAARLARGSGYRFEVEPAVLNGSGVATLIVHAGPDATPTAAIEVVGSNGAERHGAVAKVGLVKPILKPSPAPVPSETRVTIEIPGQEPIVIRLSGPGGLRALARLLLELGGAPADG